MKTDNLEVIKGFLKGGLGSMSFILLQQHRREEFSNNFISFLTFRCRFLSLVCVFYVMLMSACALHREALISHISFCSGHLYKYIENKMEH